MTEGTREFVAAHLRAAGKVAAFRDLVEFRPGLGASSPVRLRWATAAPCLPSAERFLAGILAIVFLAVAAFCAVRTFLRAVWVCLVVAIPGWVPDRAGGMHASGRQPVSPGWLPG
jgi:hypothetical protein